MIVEDEVDRGVGRIGFVETLEEGDELAAAMAVLDHGVNLAGHKVDAGQQGDRAVALVFMVAGEDRMNAGLGRQIGDVVAMPEYSERQFNRPPPRRHIAKSFVSKPSTAWELETADESHPYDNFLGIGRLVPTFLLGAWNRQPRQPKMRLEKYSTTNLMAAASIMRNATAALSLASDFAFWAIKIISCSVAIS